MAGTHQRNTAAMRSSPRCGAKTRSGDPCQSPKIAGAVRCRMHGGKGSGAPKGNRNAVKNGLYTAPMLHTAALTRAAVREERELISAVEIWLSAPARDERVDSL